MVLVSILLCVQDVSVLFVQQHRLHACTWILSLMRKMCKIVKDHVGVLVLEILRAPHVFIHTLWLWCELWKDYLQLTINYTPTIKFTTFTVFVVIMQRQLNTNVSLIKSLMNPPVIHIICSPASLFLYLNNNIRK